MRCYAKRCNVVHALCVRSDTIRYDMIRSNQICSGAAPATRTLPCACSREEEALPMLASTIVFYSICCCPWFLCCRCYALGEGTECAEERRAVWCHADAEDAKACSAAAGGGACSGGTGGGGAGDGAAAATGTERVQSGHRMEIERTFNGHGARLLDARRKGANPLVRSKARRGRRRHLAPAQPRAPARFSTLQHASARVSARQHASARVSTLQHASARVSRSQHV